MLRIGSLCIAAAQHQEQLLVANYCIRLWYAGDLCGVHGTRAGSCESLHAELCCHRGMPTATHPHGMQHKANLVDVASGLSESLIVSGLRYIHGCVGFEF